MSAAKPIETVAPDDESDLIRRLRANDAAAYETLVRTHGGRMLAVAKRMLNNEQDAADVLQEAFLAAFRAIGAFEATSKLGTWLHRIVVNAALMRLRTRSRRPEQSIETLLPAFAPDGHAADPAVDWHETSPEAAQRAETRDFILASIKKLPDNYRIVLTLRDIEGLSTEEAAAALDIEPNALKVRLHRARQALRTLLNERFRAGAL